MSFVRRSFAALFGVLLLQLTLLGSGTLCGLHQAASHAAGTSHAMLGKTGMTAASTENAASATMAMSDSDSRPTSSQDCSGLGGDGHCGLPWAPGPCSSMAACDLTVTPAASVTAANMLRPVALAAPTASIFHAGPTFAPELPPPRA